jgi:hypothetical protein
MVPAVTTNTPAPAVRLLSHFEAARALAATGMTMTPELVSTLKRLHPDGVPEADLPELQARLSVRSGLRLVGGAREAA